MVQFFKTLVKLLSPWGTSLKDPIYLTTLLVYTHTHLSIHFIMENIFFISFVISFPHQTGFIINIRLILDFTVTSNSEKWFLGLIDKVYTLIYTYMFLGRCKLADLIYMRLLISAHQNMLRSRGSLLFSPSQTLAVPLSSSSCQRGDLGSILTQKSPLRVVFLLSQLNRWFNIFSVFFRLFLWFRHLARLCLFWFAVFVRCVFDFLS